MGLRHSVPATLAAHVLIRVLNEQADNVFWVTLRNDKGPLRGCNFQFEAAVVATSSFLG